MKKILLGSLLIAALLAGCNKPTSTSSESAAQPLKLAFVTNNAADFWTIARKGCEKAEQELDHVKVDFLIPSDATAADQKRIIDDLLAKGVDGIAMSPIDPPNQTQMINDAAKQALVMTQDSDAPASDRTCYLGTDNVAAGRQAGELLKEALPDGGKVMVFVGKADAQNARERFNGLKEAIQGTKIQIIDLLTDNVDHVRAKANVIETLVNYPDIAGLVGLWSYNGPAIVNALKEANKIGQVKVVCFDEEDEALAGVKDGGIFATVVQQPYEFGRQAITVMTKTLRGDKSVIPADKKIIIPTLAIKKDKVEEFSQRIKELRGR